MADGPLQRDDIAGSDGEKMRHMEMLLNITHTIAIMDSIDDVLNALVALTTTEINAERGTIFLNDPNTGELFSRIAHGDVQREIRFLNSSGVAGWVFHADQGKIIPDAYKEERFNRDIDEQTGYVTKNILCAPIRTVKGEVIGVAQVLNKKKGKFTIDDLSLLESMTTQAAITLQNAQLVDQAKKSHGKELEFLDLVSNVIAELDLTVLLQRVMKEATRMLNAERSTLFLNDEKTAELWSQVGMGIESSIIRFPNHLGIAGKVFTSGETMNIPHAYADLNFNPAFDKQTGFFTRSILCVPVVNKQGKLIGVTQVLNKKGGPFSFEDESRLRAFTAQISIALENAKLFDDVQKMQNYNDSMLESMSNGVITFDEDGYIVTCNTPALNMLHVVDESELIGQKAEVFFVNGNGWIVEELQRLNDKEEPYLAMDVELNIEGGSIFANLTFVHLLDQDKQRLGKMMMIEDISSEKRMRSTLSKHMDPSIANNLLDGSDDILGGKETTATILFSDIRSFTSITEELGALGTVNLLNEYFTLMVECIRAEGGMLDKFIGDAVMAAFGVPLKHDDDEDRAVRVAISMMKALSRWNIERETAGKPAVHIGIGLNSDSVITGNIGSPTRMDYTIIGDGVNLAARLESACKYYKAQILISENTYNALKGTYKIRPVDRVVVKGKSLPVDIYEVLDHHCEESFPDLMDTVNYFTEGLSCYRASKWDKAIRKFECALEHHPDDGLSQMYIERCMVLKKNPPADEWDGVWEMTDK
ncbi:MAG: adenylate/guanylate cyclase domain-containing protein [Mariprofundus sp.]|nr:adenylate/guanylate cyclase domain-containing protein [Mariprofundus sp.]